MSEFVIVSRSELPPEKRFEVGKFARLYAALLELEPSEALALPTRDADHGAHIKRRLSKIAAEDGQGKKVMWRRSDDFKQYFF